MFAVDINAKTTLKGLSIRMRKPIIPATDHSRLDSAQNNINALGSRLHDDTIEYISTRYGRTNQRVIISLKVLTPRLSRNNTEAISGWLCGDAVTRGRLQCPETSQRNLSCRFETPQGNARVLRYKKYHKGL